MFELGEDDNDWYPKISELKVLQSAAGFYIGRVYMHSKHIVEPYSRESNYFQDKELAQTALENNNYIQKLN